MPIDQLVKLFLEHGAAAALAVFAIHQLRQSYEERANDLKAESARKDEDGRRLDALHRETLSAIMENTRALATLAERMEGVLKVAVAWRSPSGSTRRATDGRQGQSRK
jgi:hypothetical protein